VGVHDLVMVLLDGFRVRLGHAIREGNIDT
jgi:hypothetical protein